MEDPRLRFVPDWMRYQMDDLAPYDGSSSSAAPPDWNMPSDLTGYTGNPSDLAATSRVPAAPPPTSALPPSSLADYGYGDTAPALVRGAETRSPEERAKSQIAPYASVDKYGELRYPHRSVGQVFGDIGRGALEHLVRGESPIFGAVTGGLGIDRQQALNRRVAEATQSEAAKDQYHAQQAEALRKQQDSEYKRQLEAARATQVQMDAQTRAAKQKTYAEAQQRSGERQRRIDDMRTGKIMFGTRVDRDREIDNHIRDIRRDIYSAQSNADPSDTSVQPFVDYWTKQIDLLRQKQAEPFQPQGQAPTTQPATPATTVPVAEKSPATAQQSQTDLPPARPQAVSKVGQKRMERAPQRTTKGLAGETATGEMTQKTFEGTGEVAQPYVSPHQGRAGGGEKHHQGTVKTPGGRSIPADITKDKDGNVTSWAKLKNGFPDESTRQKPVKGQKFE